MTSSSYPFMVVQKVQKPFMFQTDQKPSTVKIVEISDGLPMTLSISGADLVIGHGPHVLRGMEVYKDKLIAYSLGNFATYGRFNISGYAGMGVILETTIDANGNFVAGKIISTKQTGRGVPTLDEEGY